MAVKIEDLQARAKAHIARDYNKRNDQSPPDTDESFIPDRKPLDWIALADRKPPDREWIFGNWVPRGHPTLLSGRGGMGKTLIAQHLATSAVVGREYLAHVSQSWRVLFWAGEDDHDELWRRQIAICQYFKIPMSALNDSLVLHSYVGVDITLATTIYGTLAPTPMLAELHEQVHDYKADLVIIDNAARVYGGNENDRHGVTTALAWMQGSCGSAALLLLAHPAKAQGSEWSGSSAWEGSVRARLYMTDKLPTGKTEKAGDDEMLDPRERYLMRRKANYAPQDVVKFEYVNGVLVPVVDPLRSLGAVTETETLEIVRRAVEQLKDIDQYGNTSTASPDYLPKLAKRYAFLGRLSEKQFATAMIGLVKGKELQTQVVGKYPNRTKRTGLVLVKAVEMDA